MNRMSALRARSTINRLAFVSLRRAFASKVDVGTITMPSLSPTMTQGTISSWKAKPGDLLKPGDILCEIETDKATLGFEVQDESVLAKILVEAHTSDVACGRPIAFTVEDATAFQEFLKLSPADLPVVEASGSAPAAPAPATSTPAPAAPVAAAHTIPANVKASPAARYWLNNTPNVDASKIQGTGKDGMIVKGDVLRAKSGNYAAPATATKTAAPTTAAVAAPVAAPSSSSGPAATPAASSSSSFIATTPVNDKYVDIPNNNMRKVIAKRLSESKQQVPHSYTTMEINMDSVMKLRNSLKKQYDISVSVNDFVIKASALALRDMPQVNSKWDSKLNQVVPSPAVDISVAVATPNGLITPIVGNADQRGLVDINKKVKDLATRARDNKLKPEEFQGGSFSISNLGK